MTTGSLTAVRGAAAAVLLGVAIGVGGVAGYGGGDLCGTPTTPQCPRSQAAGSINCPPPNPQLLARDVSDC